MSLKSLFLSVYLIVDESLIPLNCYISYLSVLINVDLTIESFIVVLNSKDPVLKSIQSLSTLFDNFL